MGHCAVDVVKKALTSCNIPFKSMNSTSLCQPCCLAKSHRLPYTDSSTQYTSPLQLVHSDLWGPSPIISRNGYRYYVTFVDHYSRFTWLYLLKTKGEVETVFKHFKSLVENQFNARIKSFQSDWGGEYRGLASFFQECGIHHRLSCPHTPQQNGLIERKHRHIVEMGLSILAQSGLSKSFWDDAFITSIFIINRLPSKVLNFSTPYEQLYHSKPKFHLLKVFGCLCYPFVRPYNKHKLDYRSSPATFLGYSSIHKGYKALLPSGKVIVTRNISFDENVFPHKSDSPAMPSHSKVDPLPTIYLLLLLLLSSLCYKIPLLLLLLQLHLLIFL